MTEHEAWLALTTEDAIDPELPICDAHQHLWNFPERTYLVEEVFRDLGGGHNVVQTVFVEGSSLAAKKDAAYPKMKPVEETRFVHEITGRNETEKYGATRMAAGIIGFANLKLGAEVAPVLEAHIAASDRFRGVREVCRGAPDSDAARSYRSPEVLLNSKFREGFACLREYGLTFDTFIFHTQSHELVDLAGTFPDIPIILNHAGGPLGIGPYAGRRDEAFQEWKSGIGLLAACPNIFIKLGGLAIRTCGFRWSERETPLNSVELAEAVAPYYLWCIEKFGAERCMFESNFPVDKASYSYTVLWNAFKRLCRGFSAEERACLFRETAAGVYRLDESPAC